jgi:hypothetical protein
MRSYLLVKQLILIACFLLLSLTGCAPEKGMVAQTIPILAGLAILVILFYPRRDPYARDVNTSYNGQRYGKERELY